MGFVMMQSTINNAWSQERVKIDGVEAVVGENIVLESDVSKFKDQIELESEGKVSISNCEMLDEIMRQKLIAHHAVVDSVIVDQSEVDAQVNRIIDNFTQQLGDINKVVDFYGFDDKEDLIQELNKVQKEQLLIQRERANIIRDISVTPEEVRTYFKSLETDGELPEFGTEIEIAQIVISPKANDDEVDRVIAKLKEIKLQIEEGSSMRLKAMVNSEDPGVTSNGGLYKVKRNSPFIKEFKETAFSLNEGEISEPFKSDFGYHIIKVEKISGQEVEARHILIKPKADPEKYKEAEETLQSIEKRIKEGSITFEEAVAEYSDDKASIQNKGLIVNPYSQDTKFELTRMDPSLYARVANLSEGELTEPFLEEDPRGGNSYKILLLKSKTEPHTADFVTDYVKIQKLAKQKKEEEAIEKWTTTKIKETYIKINSSQSSCKELEKWNLN